MKISYKRLIMFLAAFVICTSTVNAESGTGNETTEVTDTTETNTSEQTTSESGLEGTEQNQITSDSENGSAIEDRLLFVEEPNGEIDGHQLIVQNNNYELYLEEQSLSIIVRDKKTSAVMYSTVENPDTKNNITWQNFMKSGVSLEYLTGSNVNVNKVSMFTDGIQKETTISDTGFLTKVFVPDLEIGFTLMVELTETGIIAEIPEESIVEGDTHKVSGFYIYPFLGYSKLGIREGYMVIPDGSGAIINLEDNDGEYTQPYSNYIYGENIGIDEKNVPTLFKGHNIVKPSENVLMPIFGMVHTDSKIGLLGIVEGGAEYSSKIEAYPNGAVTDYDWITAKFVYRQSYNQSMSQSTGSIVVIQNERNHFDARIRYEFVSGEDASYTGLAKIYRHYLLENDALNQVEEQFKMRLDFLGLEQKNGMIFREDVVMTTIEDIKQIYNELGVEGVTNLLTIYKGWQKNGLAASSPATNFKADQAIGGNHELLDLLAELEESNVAFYLYNDPLKVDSSASTLLKYSVVKKLNKRVHEEETYKDVIVGYNYLLPSKVAEMATKLENSYVKNKVNNVMLSEISNTVFSYSIKGKIYDRMTTAQAFEDIVANYSVSFNLLLEQPFSYLWKYTDMYVDTPVSGSRYNFVDEDIPFLSIVLKGSLPMYSNYINFEANKQEYFLKLVEQGVLPSFYLTMEDPAELKYTNSSDIYSSRYDLLKDELVTYYNELKDVYSQISGATIEDHNRVDDVVTVEYSNGIKVYVNYSTKAKMIDGVTIDALSYKVGGGS
ncbi:MAG: DUF5696 domain-containing protein [Turicibacter sp.]